MERTPLLIPRQVLLDRRLSPSAKIAYATLASVAPTNSFDWEVEMSLQDMSTRSGMQIGSCSLAIDKLVKVGWLERIKQGSWGGAGRYRAALPKKETHRV